MMTNDRNQWLAINRWNTWSADLGNAERPLRTNSQNSTNGGGKKHAEAPEQCGCEGSIVR